MYGAAFRRKRFNSDVRNDGCTRYCSHAHSFAVFLTYLSAGDIPTWFDSWGSGSCFGDCLCHDFVLVNQHPIAPYSFYPKVVSMGKPNESTMKRAIRLVGECYSIYGLNPSVGSSDCIHFQNLSESSNINFDNHSSSSTLTRGIVLVLFKIQKGNSKKISKANIIWSWKTNGESSFLCVGSPNLSYGVVFSMKEVTWILKYTNILDERNTLVLGTATKTIPRVELALSLMIYGNTWFPKNRREPNVSWSFVRSLLIFLSVLQPTSRWNWRIRSKDYTSGLSLRYAILTAASMYISGLSLVIGPRLWLERAVCTNQSHNRQLEWLPTRFGSSWPCKRCCWDVFWVGEGY